MELDYNMEEMEKEIEQKYKEKYATLTLRYQGEIADLHYTI